LLGASLSLSIILLFDGSIDASFFILNTNDIIYLILLSVVATAFTSILSVQVLKSISPYTLIMTLNLETVYSIILAFLLFRQSEQMDFRFYIGTVVLLAVIVLNGYFKGRERTK
jgi:drug/metabolite transporter (DMT)-like permease